MKSFMQFVALLMGILLLSTAVASDKVVVLPDSSVKKKIHVVTVAPAGGDFTDPVAAVKSIDDATAQNPYMVLIDPGVFTLTETLVLKPFVAVAGAGREATTLTGAISTLAYDASSAIVSGADNVTLSNLTIENTGGGAVSIALYNNGCSPVVQDVSLRASGGRYNYGIYNTASAPTLTEVIATASGGMYNYDVFNSSPPPASD